MKLGFVYAGQGTQYVGMGQSFYEANEDCKEIIDGADLDFDLKKIMFESDEKTISTTRFTQPAMVAVACMATLLLKKNGIEPNYVCGLSLGEYSALNAGGVLDAHTAIKVVRERGLAMEKAAEGIESAMMAILGLEREPLLDICEKCDGYVSIANYNCPGQLVIAGEKKAVEEACQKAIEAGARRAVKLNTSGPFHTSLLKDASLRLHEVFKDITFNEMKIPVIFNSTGKELENSTVSEMLERQVMSPVYFEDSIRYMLDHGVDTIVEIGPGKVLSGFVRKINRKIKTYQVEDMDSLHKCVEALKDGTK